VGLAVHALRRLRDRLPSEGHHGAAGAGRGWREGVTTRETRDFQRCAVIGGAGMLGFEIARQLVAAGKQVSILDLQAPPEAICQSRLGDIRCREDLVAACTGAELVFQTAAVVWDVNTPDDVYDEVNVAGNRLVVDICRELGIRRLVYTSTIDVVVDGRRPIVYGDESLPYPKRMPRTRIRAPRSRPNSLCSPPTGRVWPPARCGLWACTGRATATTWAT